eukprot:3505987-Rhodomonas_salina.1
MEGGLLRRRRRLHLLQPRSHAPHLPLQPLHLRRAPLLPATVHVRASRAAKVAEQREGGREGGRE